jgi:gag-polypeptide of LTR copia-type
MADVVTHFSGSYQIELLKGTNWMLWKRRMQAILQDQDLDIYIESDAASPVPADKSNPTTEEIDTIKKWRNGDAKARTQIELSIGDSKMIHIIRALTASEMWKQLTLVKESRGKLGVLATQRALYRSIAEEGFDLVTHVSNLRKLQEELHLMSNLVSDEDFAMILVSSLPESWDLYTSAYLGSKTDGKMLTSHELIAILLKEEQQCKERTGDPRNVAMTGKFSKHDSKKKTTNTNKECYNCHKKGHVSKDCWSKGGSKEGQGPKSR